MIAAKTYLRTGQIEQAGRKEARAANGRNERADRNRAPP